MQRRRIGELTFSESLNMLHDSEYSPWVETIFASEEQRDRGVWVGKMRKGNKDVGLGIYVSITRDSEELDHILASAPHADDYRASPAQSHRATATGTGAATTKSRCASTFSYLHRVPHPSCLPLRFAPMLLQQAGRWGLIIQS